MENPHEIDEIVKEKLYLGRLPSSCPVLSCLVLLLCLVLSCLVLSLILELVNSEDITSNDQVLYIVEMMRLI
jgi:hypothetical protein